MKAVDTPEPWADVFAASKRLVDSPSYAVGAFRALVARAYDWEVAAKARLQARLTLAESSRALDALFDRVPELLRTAPPGTPPDDPDKFTQKWRSLARTPRERLERLEAKAELFSRQ